MDQDEGNIHNHIAARGAPGNTDVDIHANKELAGTQVAVLLKPGARVAGVCSIGSNTTSDDVPPILSSASVWSPIPYPEEIGREETFY
ncbi:hypothetical protein EIQ30_23320 [Xanthomonas campestris]